MSIAKANKILKDLGMGRVKFQKDYSGWNTVCYKNWEGKMVNGISLSSHSPMDVTSEASKRIMRKTNEVYDALSLEFPKTTDGEDGYIVAETSRTLTRLVFMVEYLPTYTRSMNLDPGYKTSYLVPTFLKEKK